MAVDALRARGARLVTMVRGHVVLLGIVTLRTDCITGGSQLLRVRIVAVAAGDAGRVHAALQPRAQDEHLVALLCIGPLVACLVALPGMAPWLTHLR